MEQGTRLDHELETYDLIGERQYSLLDLEGAPLYIHAGRCDVDRKP